MGTVHLDTIALTPLTINPKHHQLDKRSYSPTCGGAPKKIHQPINLPLQIGSIVVPSVGVYLKGTRMEPYIYLTVGPPSPRGLGILLAPSGCVKDGLAHAVPALPLYFCVCKAQASKAFKPQNPIKVSI